MNRRRIAIGAAAVSGVAVVGVAAAQMMSGGVASQPANAAVSVSAVRAAAETTAEAKTAQVETIVTETTGAVPAKGTTPAIPAITRSMHGVGIFDFGQQVGKIDLTTANRSLQEILTPAALYLRDTTPAAQAAAAQTATKGWSKSDTGKLGDGNLVSGGSTDPEMVLALLAGTQPNVKLIGQDKVRDVAVTHYQGTIDLTAAANAVTVPPVPAAVAGRPADPAAAAAAANAAADKKALTNAAKTFSTTAVPFDAFIDADGRLRRFVATFSFVAPGPAKVPAQVVSSTDLFAFGIPVGVSTPASPVPASGTATVSGTPAATEKRQATSPSPSRSAHK